MKYQLLLLNDNFIIQKNLKSSQGMNDTHFKYCCVACVPNTKIIISIESSQRCFLSIEDEREKKKILVVYKIKMREI